MHLSTINNKLNKIINSNRFIKIYQIYICSVKYMNKRKHYNFI